MNGQFIIVECLQEIHYLQYSFINILLFECPITNIGQAGTC